MATRSVLWVLPSGATTVVEVDEEGNRVSPLPSDKFGGKGDHDGDGKVGGAHEPIPTPTPKRGKTR